MLTNRNPRNPNHIAEAIAIIRERAQESSVLESAVPELRAAGVPFPKGTKVRKTVDPGSAVVGMFFLIERGLIMPDNVIRKCEECQTAVQVRPALAYSLGRLLCVFCAAEKLLAQ